ncbi:MAG TPA: methyltransferase domain-containing protein [Terriglobales bacterium]|nr:methyltransferase domain-containing protein [Terriglobales bacterium]
MILIASILVAITGLLGDFVVDHKVLHMEPPGTLTAYSEVVAHGLWFLAETVAITLLCVLLINFYKNLNIGCYPTTFLYSFILPATSNPSGKSQVVGYCQVAPNTQSGEFEITGASYSWEAGHPNTDGRVRFTSSKVYGSKEEEETTCHIQFTVHPADAQKRFYDHGLLLFRLDKTAHRKADEGSGIYAGFLQATYKDAEGRDVNVRSEGYAEWYSNTKTSPTDLESTLRARGNGLVAQLEAMLAASPQPTLWEEMREKEKDYMEENDWGIKIPTPQSIALNPQLKPYIDRLLSQMLSLCGLQEPAIGDFKARAEHEARVNRYDTRVAYERELKAGLIGMVRETSLDDALSRRAETIKAQIEPYLEGDSLLDIGCGNGMVADLIKDHFTKDEVQLVDVKRYLPSRLRRQLSFTEYQEGEPLPFSKQFDTVLLLTVLHHSRNPRRLLKLAWGITAKKLIIIESVVGIHVLVKNAKYELVNSPIEIQVGYAAFVDWFYNRVLHNDVPVPYNFTTPEMWKSEFERNHMKLAHTIHLGQDIDIGPEYHILFVLQRG